MQRGQAGVEKQGWLRNCWRISVVNLLAGTSLYMAVPFIPQIFSSDWPLGALYMGLAYVAGLLLPGPFCNYWFDTYRRKSVCRWALWMLLVAQVLLFWVAVPVLKPLCCLLLGAAVGLFQYSAGSTLLVDLSPTERRTLASHIYYWFTRLALALGPVVAWLVVKLAGYPWLPVVSVACVVLAVLLLQTVEVPFRAPLEPSVLSLDRFWMPRAFRLFAGFLLVAVSSGLVFSCLRCPECHALMAVGFLCSLLLHRVGWIRRDVRREVLFGMALMGLSVLMLLCLPFGTGWLLFPASLLLAWGLGHVGSRYLLFFVRVSEHCERGTAQSTYLIAWEAGLALGVSGGCQLAEACPEGIGWVALSALLGALGVYVLFVHRWYVHACRR